MTTITCPKCSGSKKLYRFAHVADGDCFECGATGVVTTSATVLAADRAEEKVTEENALAQLRVLYRAARSTGGAWFAADDYSGWPGGMAYVSFYAASVPAAKAGHVLAAFEALRAA